MRSVISTVREWLTYAGHQGYNEGRRGRSPPLFSRYGTRPHVYFMPNTHRRRDETVFSSRRRRCEHNWQLAHDDCRRIRLTIWKLTKQTPWRLITPILINIDNFFTAQCPSANARSWDRMSSVRLSVCDVGGLWSHRLEILENNGTAN